MQKSNNKSLDNRLGDVVRSWLFWMMGAGTGSNTGGQGGVQPWVIAVAVVGAILVAAVAVLAFFVARRRRHPPYHEGPKLASDVRCARPLAMRTTAVLLPSLQRACYLQTQGLCQQVVQGSKITHVWDQHCRSMVVIGTLQCMLDNNLMEPPGACGWSTGRLPARVCKAQSSHGLPCQGGLLAGP